MSTGLNLTPYAAVQQATFVKLTVTEAGLPVVVRMSTYHGAYSIVESDGASHLYPAVGTLMGVSEISADQKSSTGDVAVTISGIPNEYMADIMNNPIKGSPIEIRRVFFNATTGAILAISGNPVMEFSGVVNNFSVDEGWSDQYTKSVTTSITLSCSSIMSVLSRKVSGRRTNNDDENYWFPGDKAFSRVAVISDAVFDFGGTTPSSKAQPLSGVTQTQTVTG
jgi:hypothetical protein